MERVRIVGGGLAGCEAAWQLADRGVPVDLVEMRPVETTGAHRSDRLAEVVCSNSFKSILADTASGILKIELDTLGSRLLETARATAVPAGHALAVDRDSFSAAVTDALMRHPRVTIERKRQDDLDVPLPAIVATGPLTAEPLSSALAEHVSAGHLHFYDAIAPSIDAESIDGNVGFHASRYNKGAADYLNIPLTAGQYGDLVREIREAETVTPHAFEDEKYFESCLPVEVMARRGVDTLRFGPLRPKGLVDPRSGKEPYAVVQLRRETGTGSLLGLVGFQTRMTYEAQKRVLRTIPGFSGVRILRYGSIHRNMYMDLPKVCGPYQRDRKTPRLYYAGQICGVEGYVECIASGLVAALSVFADLSARALPDLPGVTMMGSLMKHVHTAARDFQPMNANMGLLPPIAVVRGGRRQRYAEFSRRAGAAIRNYRLEHGWLFDTTGRRPDRV